MSVPERLTVKFDDGSTKSIDFSRMDRRRWLRLAHLGICPPPPITSQPSKSYVLLQWQDGWQEVISVDKCPVDLLRYYVLERVETVGRMALQTSNGSPLLLLIRRKPKNLTGATIISDGSRSFYHFEPRVKKEGDKIEHVEYDKAEKHFQHAREPTEDIHVKKLLDSLKVELDNRGFNAKQLLSISPEQRAIEYQKLAKTLGIRTSEEQDDVYGFIHFLVESLYV